MILILRGHIRNSFKTPYLKQWGADMHQRCPDLKIYVHTWNVFANTISWRRIQGDSTPVTKETVFRYFGEWSSLIQHVIVDDDSTITLIGNTVGKINNYMAPIRGWKNYWYGKYQIIHHLKDISPDEMIVNTRFDVMMNPYNALTHGQLLSFIQENKEAAFTKNKFMYDEQHSGIDNIYLGNIRTMYPLIHHFYYHLDDILQKYPIDVQENMVFLVNEELSSKMDYIIP